jgi:hypothetical protein
LQRLDGKSFATDVHWQSRLRRATEERRLAAVLAGARADSASLPVKAVRWFLGLDEADKFALPLQPTGNISGP